jgi:hypothetical protein
MEKIALYMRLAQVKPYGNGQKCNKIGKVRKKNHVWVICQVGTPFSHYETFRFPFYVIYASVKFSGTITKEACSKSFTLSFSN